jgi:hypothetical protein
MLARMIEAKIKRDAGGMANLTLKPTDMGHGPLKDDYAVLDEGRNVIGRIFLDTMPIGSPPWFWGNNRIPNLPGVDRNHAMTLAEAKAAFKASWERPGRTTGAYSNNQGEATAPRSSKV